ncbi:MAG: hypothetical protein KKE42_08960 [Alphaproteobacteria bacterium]|uniref:hypothetical protein n=1 Tax=Brevundimonas sp. TaxID=1871086 RepID=UPI0018492B39|nr:hypothetical protein [Brevundimonas sp.]MBA3050042.1 hypothetical protein [Brevundimonas sp.]MBU3971543.1 hypothetical protein [Alphaproteobacteria bacterium]MBU3973912.1 hypothetical protein [Alphaproteobacteria bacterium]MBU4136891.1 hypothetical protein [Alphaproteobacteria bacterium]
MIWYPAPAPCSGGDRNDQVRVIRLDPANPCPTVPGLTAYFTIEVGRLVQIGGVLLKAGDNWSVKLASPSHRRDRIDFAPPAGRKIVRDAVVKAWEARNVG